MAVYHWYNSKAFANYGSGHIIVNADSIEEASLRVRLYAKKWIQENRGYWDEEDVDEFLNQLDLDLIETPDLVLDNVIFIEGSE